MEGQAPPGRTGDGGQGTAETFSHTPEVVSAAARLPPRSHYAHFLHIYGDRLMKWAMCGCKLMTLECSDQQFYKKTNKKGFKGSSSVVSPGWSGAAFLFVNCFLVKEFTFTLLQFKQSTWRCIYDIGIYQHYSNFGWPKFGVSVGVKMSQVR